MSILFADIILPFPLEQTFTYQVPEKFLSMAVAGMRVEVSFRKKIYNGIIYRTHHHAPSAYRVKEIIGFPDDAPVVNENQLLFWDWIARYYMSTLGDVFQAAVPNLYKLSSMSQVVLNQHYSADINQLPDQEYLIAEALTTQKELSIADVQQILQKKNVQPILNALLSKGVIFIKEEIKEGFIPRKIKHVVLAEAYLDETALQALFESLNKAPRQQDLLMMYYQLTQQTPAIHKTVLLKKAGVSAAVLQSMIQKGIFEETEEVVSRVEKGYQATDSMPTLSDAQAAALRELQTVFKSKQVALLHGVTGSGKTEVYMHLMEEVIARGQQVVYLLPEIALTSQMINRLRKRFGSRVGVYHSKFNNQERVEIWQNIKKNKYDIVLGARSALFLPFENPGLFIVDEEHDYSYKQQDPAPRYHARDAAIYLASLYGAKTVLGSATPSAESFHHSRSGKYGYVVMNDRFAGLEMPEVQLIDMKQAYQSKKVTSLFSQPLIDGIRKAVAAKEQVILFQNRRGYSPHVQCGSCGWTPHCFQCDVQLVYHKAASELRCHYCGYKHEVWHNCPECGSSKLLVQGYGTEKIEEELQVVMPELRIARLDLDAVKTKAGHERVLNLFEEGLIDVLVGTQMVTKGLDFDHVSLVGILSADQILNFADFRSAERGYQLMMQVSGRAGRKHKQGLVMLQALQVNHPVLKWVMQHDTQSFYKIELEQRKKFLYPPYVRLIRILLKHKEQKTALQAAQALAQAIGKGLHFALLGPVEPPVNRIRNKYIFEMLIKVEVSSKSLNDVKERVWAGKYKLLATNRFRSVEIVPDVDPI